MKELATPIPHVAKAEVEVCSAIAMLAKRIQSQYELGIKLRRESNAVGIKLGKQIVEACRDPQIEAAVRVANGKEKKPNGGTDSRAHCWVAKQLAAVMDYNAEYLTQCAREYLGALKQHCEEKKEAPPVYLKGGVLKIAQKELPDLKLEPPLTTPADAPRMDAMFVFEETNKEESTIHEKAREAAAFVCRKLGLTENTVNPIAIRAFVRAIQPVLDAAGFVVETKGPIARSLGTKESV